MISGDFPQAIETLVTAISLIKQSKVANDERCKILVSHSLELTLHAIETERNSLSRKGRPRIRDQSRDEGQAHEHSKIHHINEDVDSRFNDCIASWRNTLPRSSFFYCSRLFAHLFDKFILIF